MDEADSEIVTSTNNIATCSLLLNEFGNKAVSKVLNGKPRNCSYSVTSFPMFH